MSHTRRSLPQYTHHLLHTLGIVEVRNSRRQAADKSYIFCVSLGGSGGSVLVFVCTCVRAWAWFFFASECEYKCVCAHGCLCASANSHPHVPNKRAHWSMWKNEDLKRRGPGSYHSSGLTLARPPLANSRQQIRSLELPTELVTGTWWRAGRPNCFPACMDHDRGGMRSVYSQNK